MNERRRPYYLITGLVLGLLLGLLYARVLNPPVLVNLTPGRLNPVDQDQYRLMIALAFQADGDLGRANARLDLLGSNPLADLASQAQRTLAGGGSMEDARALALLAQALTQQHAVDVGAELRAHAPGAVAHAEAVDRNDVAADADGAPQRGVVRLPLLDEVVDRLRALEALVAHVRACVGAPREPV